MNFRKKMNEAENLLKIELNEKTKELNSLKKQFEDISLENKNLYEHIINRTKNHENEVQLRL